MAILDVSDLKQYFYLEPTFLAKLVGGKKPRIIKAVEVIGLVIDAMQNMVSFVMGRLLSTSANPAASR